MHFVPSPDYNLHYQGVFESHRATPVPQASVSFMEQSSRSHQTFEGAGCSSWVNDVEEGASSSPALHPQHDYHSPKFDLNAQKGLLGYAVSVDNLINHQMYSTSICRSIHRMTSVVRLRKP